MPVDFMEIPIDDVPERGAVSKAGEFSESDLIPEGVESIGLIGAHLSGELKRIDTEFLFEGAILGRLAWECDRCLAPTEIEVDVPLALLFTETAPQESENDAENLDIDENESEGVYAIHNDRIGLRGPVWEELVLALPKKAYCAEDCKGLCPSCGHNLNEGPCGCAAATATGTSPFDALRDVLPDLPDGVSQQGKRHT